MHNSTQPQVVFDRVYADAREAYKQFNPNIGLTLFCALINSGDKTAEQLICENIENKYQIVMLKGVRYNSIRDAINKLKVNTTIEKVCQRIYGGYTLAESIIDDEEDSTRYKGSKNGAEKEEDTAEIKPEYRVTPYETSEDDRKCQIEYQGKVYTSVLSLHGDLNDKLGVSYNYFLTQFNRCDKDIHKTLKVIYQYIEKRENRKKAAEQGSGTKIVAKELLNKEEDLIEAYGRKYETLQEAYEGLMPNREIEAIEYRISLGEKIEDALTKHRSTLLPKVKIFGEKFTTLRCACRVLDPELTEEELIQVTNDGMTWDEAFTLRREQYEALKISVTN